jgi:hypothetical protein
MRKIVAGLAAAAALSAAVGTAGPAAAHGSKPQGERSLAAVLLSSSTATGMTTTA